jgi:hypothetical protein
LSCLEAGNAEPLFAVAADCHQAGLRGLKRRDGGERPDAVENLRATAGSTDFGALRQSHHAKRRAGFVAFPDHVEVAYLEDA